MNRKELIEAGLVRWGKDQFRCEDCGHISDEYDPSWMRHKEGCDYMNPIKLMAIDPGVTTGYCFGELGTSLVLSPQQHEDDVDEMWDRMEKFDPRFIIIEDFEFRQRARTGLVLFSVQLIGVARLYEAIAHRKGRQCATIQQKAAQGKGYYTDNVLKQIGAHKRGVRHGNDATRHLLQWLNFGAGYKFIEGRDISKLVVLK